MSNNPYENIYNSENKPEPVVNEPQQQQANVENNPYEYHVDYSEAPVSEQLQSVQDTVPVSLDEQLPDYQPVLQNSCEWNTESSPVLSEENFAPYKAPESKKTERKKRNKKTPTALLLVLCIVLSSVFGAVSAITVNHLSNRNKHTISGGSITINQLTPDYNSSDTQVAELSTVEIVERTADAVVEITTESVKTGVFAQQYIESGAGSGVIIDSTGYLVTNHHVIEGAQKITVTLRTGESYDARLLGSDEQIDLALLKIEAEELTAAVFGNSDNLRVGQRTVAIGNPLGQLGGSVTEGIISALDRDLVVDGQTMTLLQTDTAINPGNSGGGLFDTQGALIGIVVAKSSGSEVEGLGFAIPVNKAVDAISDLKEFGYIRGRAYTGMEFIDVDSVQLAWMYGLSDMGCYVYSVGRGTNAEEAGFKSGDLILSVDGKEVKTSDDVEAILNKKSVGDEVVFSVQRNRAQGELTLKLEEYIPDSANAFTDND